MERNRSIDLLKSIAIIGVIVIHTCSNGGYSNPMLSFDWLSAVFWGSLTRASVPIFFMCSGALLLSPQKELSLKKLYSKNLLRIVIALFVWAMAYKVYTLPFSHSLNLQTIFQAIKETLLFNHEFHLYYLHIIILVYAFLPVTRIFVKNATQSELKYALAVWFVLGIIYPTVKSFWPFTLLSGIPTQWAMNMTYSAIGYGILGYYLSCYPLPSKKLSLSLTAVGFVIVFVPTVVMSVKTGSLYSKFFEGMSFNVALLAIGLFGLCQNISIKTDGIFQRTITKISKASFCIYLVHVFVLHIFSYCNITVNFLPTIISIPMLMLVNFIISYCCYAVLSRIPIVKKWLI